MLGDFDGTPRRDGQTEASSIITTAVTAAASAASARFVQRL